MQLTPIDHAFTAKTEAHASARGQVLLLQTAAQVH